MCDLGEMEEEMTKRGSNTQAFLGSSWMGVLYEVKFLTT